MENLKKIGIMGGTFNPIHNGHLALAARAYEQFKLDQILFMPSKNPPHKELKTIISDKHRVDMVSLAISDIPDFVLSTLELERGGTTYTVDTLDYLTKTEKDKMFYFILGADSLFELEDWLEPARIMEMAKIIVASRNTLSNENITERIQYLNSTYNTNIELIEMPPIDISSRHIRECIKNHHSICNYVPKPVEDYIYENNLYRT
ncbi:nicotinate-nucleotide adenylyltransferase [Mobilisporobacter senegalensis]|uniref:Probable nicotinate-nucleotide adenylyltransferase n=1 Tax=Mobilisporobacter senegalensis TaxID=1329262 RepID=A0A3N1XVQ5_9FIRM|nr:nicotinate-nucleotide adenylyltransferase [Mobilisporobacter senegalensis]ROR29262.1 nicotinate-nucleotide adenylyltransferase [Mobilisporobacter senegalensis]